MLPDFVLAFKKNIYVTEEGSDRVTIQSPLIQLNIPQQTLKLDKVAPGLLAAIRILAAEGATEKHLSDLVLETDGLAQLPKFYYYLEKFIRLGMLCLSVMSEGEPLATLVPLCPYEKFQLKEASLEKKYVLSRFAYSRKDEGQLVLECPLSHAKIVLADWKGAALIAELAKPQVVGELFTTIPGLSEETVRQFFSLLLSAEMLGEVQENGKIEEEENEAIVQWEFHDLLFHSRSRTGRNDKPFGRTYPFLGKIEPLPAVKPKVSDDAIALYKPDIEKLKAEDYPFTRILEERKSIKKYNDDKPITDKQLGEFLYRSARIREVFHKDKEEISSRPYPNGGAAYELELYVTVNTCENIPSGLYHYCPQEHQLCKISGRNSYVEALLKEVQLANRKRSAPQILLIIAARFPRITWHYESLAYATILKNLGALLQTMYLVASAMQLAPCAIGEGNSDLFATATGTDYFSETSVGEFMLGSKAVV